MIEKIISGGQTGALTAPRWVSPLSTASPAAVGVLLVAGRVNRGHTELLKI